MEEKTEKEILEMMKEIKNFAEKYPFKFKILNDQLKKEDGN